MKQKPTNWQQELDDESVEEYNGLRRSLQRNDDFGLFFVQCSPATSENIIAAIQEDISQKKIEVLRLTKPVDSLYDIIIDLPNIENIDILFISGLEHSLYEYEQYTFDNSDQETYATSKERYSQSWRGVPRFLGYLNLQRDRFREDFNISFIFLLPSFGIDYFIKRAPDFFDWRSGLFEFVSQKDDLIAVAFNSISQANDEFYYHELLTLQAIATELEPSDNKQAKLAYKQFLLYLNSQRYEDAMTQINLWLKSNKDYDQVWSARGITLRKLGRYEEAVASYDKALDINPDNYLSWNNRAYALFHLERYEEAISSYDKASEIEPDHDFFWNNRGIALNQLGRHAEAVASYNKALEINPDRDFVWSNRGNALYHLGRYEEATISYNKALEITPDDPIDLIYLGIALSNLGKYKEVIISFKKAIKNNPDLALTLLSLPVKLIKLKWQNLIRSWKNFFNKLINR